LSDYISTEPLQMSERYFRRAIKPLGFIWHVFFRFARDDMAEVSRLWRERQEQIACTEADLVVADAVKRWSPRESDRQPFYLLQWVAGGKAASRVYRDRLHENFVKVCN
jgi:hypothetical protein